MGFGKKLGTCVGTVIGATIRIGTDIVGDVTKNDHIKDIGESAMRGTVRTWERLGQVADGVGGLAVGVATGDGRKASAGVSEAGGAVVDTIKGIASGIGGVVVDGVCVINGLATGNKGAAREASVRLIKTAATVVLVVGPPTMLDDFDFVDEVGIEVPDMIVDTNNVPGEMDGLENVHYVEGGFVHGYSRADGTFVGRYWRGDQDPGLDVPDVPGGYLQSNPNETTLDNLDPTRRISS